MSRLKTSPNEIMRWLGVSAIRRSEDLKPVDPRKARMARILWGDGGVKGREPGPWIDGGDDDAA